MSQPHYPFPPAAAYRLNRCLWSIKSDADYCARVAADPGAAAAATQLSAEERAALWPMDRDALVRLGGHPYLIFMAELRLRMTREPSSLEYF